jgi:hypothetical protein
MAMTRVCDICGKPVKAPFKQLKVLKAESDTQEPKTYRTIGSMDFHENCFEGFTGWLANQQGLAIARIDSPDDRRMVKDVPQA